MGFGAVAGWRRWIMNEEVEEVGVKAASFEWLTRFSLFGLDYGSWFMGQPIWMGLRFGARVKGLYKWDLFSFSVFRESHG